MLPKFLLKEAIVAPPGFNRWRVPPASVAIHLCIGSVYAWSVFNAPLTRLIGVEASAAGDWTLSNVVVIYSIAIAFLGLSAALAGGWLEKVGPRCVGVTSACLWGSGFIVSAIGIKTHQLWLIYLGYGVLGGCGLGLGYVSPVSTLIRWFPDRRGMATGMAIMGFGGGTIIGAPLAEWLISRYRVEPESVQFAKIVTEESGRRVAEVAGQWREVVVTDHGTFLTGTGDTGAAAAFVTLGVLYFLVMVAAAFSYRIPAEGWKPSGWRPPSEAETGKRMISTHHVGMNEALRTPQFWLLWVVLCFNVTAGIGVLGVAKTMMTEIFGTTLKHIVTPAFALTYVTMTSVFNMAGRIGWASASDRIGRQRTYFIFFALGSLLYLSIPMLANAVSAQPSEMWLWLFYAATMLIFTMYGGGFATIPAYLADIFGTRFVGAIHGRLLTAWSVAGVAGPSAITLLREHSAHKAIHDLAAKVDPAAFQEKFGQPVSNLSKLIEAKTVTVSRMMELAPAGTIDPTPGLYNTTMFVMAGLLVVALIANSRIRPVAAKHYLKD